MNVAEPGWVPGTRRNSKAYMRPMKTTKVRERAIAKGSPGNAAPFWSGLL